MISCILHQLKKTDMLVEMEDMMKRSPIEIVENVLVKIDKFLFPSDFVVMDMLNTRNETMILGRPFLATIHAEIDVFNKEISLGITGDGVTFAMNKKMHNFTTPIGEFYMINSTSNNEYTFHTSSDASSRVEKTDDLHNYYDQDKDEGELKFCPTCDPNIRECNGGLKIYGMDEEGVIKNVNYEETQEKELIWDDRFEEWCNNNPNTPTSRFITIQENLSPRPKDYPFKDWLLTKKVQGDNTYWWHDQKLEEEERRQLGINIEEYDPPMFHVETFEIKSYLFDTGQNFICVTKELMDALPLGRENRSRFRDMIHKEVDSGTRIHRQTFYLQGSGILGLLDSFSCGSKVLSDAITDIITA
ncbi:RNA-directed DNA polymerase, eukaryota, reverse transcriptase zinc-binding domain protein [Tanacetum coccineum]